MRDSWEDEMRSALQKLIEDWLRLALALGFCLVATGIPGRASALSDEEPGDEAVDRQPASQESLRMQRGMAAERAARRIYPGGRDEQDLKPQATLPAPSRTLDGGPAPVVGRADAPAE